MNNTLFIAIDPGAKFTGIMGGTCIPVQIEKDNLPNDKYTYEEAVIRHIELLIETAKAGYPTSRVVLIIEDFKLYKHKADVQSFQTMKTSELIGMIKTRFKDCEIVMQSASQAKIWTNARLVKLGFFVQETSAFYRLNVPFSTSKFIHKHTRDAFRHLVYYLNKNVFNNCITAKEFFKIGLNYKPKEK